MACRGTRAKPGLHKKYLAPFVGLFFLAAASAAAAEVPVSIKTMTPSQLRMASIGRLANVALVVRMEVHPDNRGLEVFCDGINGGIRTSSGELFEEGEKQQKKIYDVGFFLSSATYRCEAVLKRNVDGDEKQFTSSVEVTVR